jgi:hypothetical protein
MCYTENATVFSQMFIIGPIIFCNWLYFWPRPNLQKPISTNTQNCPIFQSGHHIFVLVAQKRIDLTQVGDNLIVRRSLIAMNSLMKWFVLVKHKLVDNQSVFAPTVCLLIRDCGFVV